MIELQKEIPKELFHLPGKAIYQSEEKKHYQNVHGTCLLLFIAKF